MDFKKKYIKYKQKYIHLKKLFGGRLVDLLDKPQNIVSKR